MSTCGIFPQIWHFSHFFHQIVASSLIVKLPKFDFHSYLLYHDHTIIVVMFCFFFWYLTVYTILSFQSRASHTLLQVFLQEELQNYSKDQYLLQKGCWLGCMAPCSYKRLCILETNLKTGFTHGPFLLHRILVKLIGFSKVTKIHIYDPIA